MITTTSKNNSFICVEDVCDGRMVSCLECDAHVEQQTHPLKQHLHELWINIRLFLGTDRWNRAVTLQRGDSHYTMKVEDIEARWRNR
jgi:hypothetical protein